LKKWKIHLEQRVNYGILVPHQEKTQIVHYILIHVKFVKTYLHLVINLMLYKVKIIHTCVIFVRSLPPTTVFLRIIFLPVVKNLHIVVRFVVSHLLNIVRL
jgi:hypothetical protein